MRMVGTFFRNKAMSFVLNSAVTLYDIKFFDKHGQRAGRE
ncbi:MAG: hypothetical protein JWM99_224 [Verrucomicrobiales bacterium]|nr:hypothetical protein [Verrucomicrobiales bacterium]